MRPLDDRRYEQLVVRPLRERATDLPDDLTARYAVELDMDNTELAARLADVRRLWAARAPVGGYLGSVYTAFRVADAELCRRHGRALLDIDWWRAGAGATARPPGPGRGAGPRRVIPIGDGAAPSVSGSRPVSRFLEIPPLQPDVPHPAPSAPPMPPPPPPPAPVSDVTVRPAGTGVEVAWCPADDRGEPLACRVVRQDGRLPATVVDGDPVGETDRTSLVDPAPPAGRPLGYAVFVRGVGETWSPPAGATTTVVPPVVDLQVRGERGAVVGRWTEHPDVEDVQVLRRTTTGEPDRAAVLVPTSGGRTFRDDTVETGTEYEYSLTACYRASGLRTLRAETVVVRCAPRPDAAPVAGLSAEPVESGGSVAVRLQWWQPIGAEVQIRRSAMPSPHGYGDAVPVAELDAVGAVLPPGVRSPDGTTDLTTEVPPGRWYFTAFTLASGEALRGRHAVADVVGAVGGLEAQRRGDEISLAWIWPPGVSVTEVAWSEGARRVTRRQYIDDGFRVVAGPEAERFEVRSVALAADGAEIVSAPVFVDVDAPATAVSYTVGREGGLLRRGPRRIVITLSADRAVRGCEVVLVAAPGETMPREPEFGEELLHESLDLDPAAGPTRLEAPLPRLSRPYWVRCFLLEPDGVRFIDPPVSQLKVS